MAARAVRLQAADLVTALQGKVRPRGRPAGGGWYTETELEKRLDLSPARTRRLLGTEREAGRVEQAPGTIRDAGGVERNVTYYRLKGAK